MSSTILKDALIDTLWTLGVTQTPISQEVANDVIGYLRNQHDVWLIEERDFPSLLKAMTPALDEAPR